MVNFTYSRTIYREIRLFEIPELVLPWTGTGRRFSNTVLRDKAGSITLDYIKAANVNDFKNSRIKSVTILGRKVGIIKGPDSEFYAIEVGCKHQGADITRGHISGNVATCPRHGWKFDLLTGECLNQNASKLKKYGLKIEGDVIMITSKPLPEEEEDDPLLHFFD